MIFRNISKVESVYNKDDINFKVFRIAGSESDIVKSYRIRFLSEELCYVPIFLLTSGKPFIFDLSNFSATNIPKSLVTPVTISLKETGYSAKPKAMKGSENILTDKKLIVRFENRPSNILDINPCPC